MHGLRDSDFADLVAETHANRACPAARASRAIFEEGREYVEWRRGALGTVHGGGPLREIPVILLREPAGELRSQPYVRSGVFVETVRRSSGGTTPRVERRGREPPRHMGRVGAHKMVDSLAPELSQTKHGLMRHALDHKALVGRTRTSHAECVGAVRTTLKLMPTALTRRLRPCCRFRRATERRPAVTAARVAKAPLS